MRIGGYRRSGGGGFKWRLIVLAAFALYGLFYYFSNRGTVPLTGRKQMVDMNPQEEMALGLRSYLEILSQERVLQGGPIVDKVREIGDRLAIAAKEFDPGYEWEYNVVESAQANAFALPGGKVAVYTGIIPVAANEDGLAVIMGHEIAHALARHSAERMAQGKLMNIGSMAVGVATGDLDYGTRNAIMQAYGMGTKYGAILPFSRNHESEADYMGLILMARACYDPREAPNLWQRMSENSKGAPAEFMSTHPSNQTRIKQFSQWMPQALEEYKKYCG